MERRTAIKQIFFIAAGASMLHSCVKSNKAPDIKLTNLSLSTDQQELVSELAEVILPSADSPGSKELKLGRFILRMVDDCYEPEDRQKFSEGLSAFDKLSDEQFGKPFVSLDKDKRESLLKQIDATLQIGSEKEKENPAIHFFATVKDLAIRGYMTSEYVMTNKLYYNMVPGTFKGCVKVNDMRDFKTILG